MSALRMPQHLGDAAHVDGGEAQLKFDLLEGLDGAVGRTERDVELAVRALRDHAEAGGDPTLRQALLDRAVDAAWRLIVQHEACDLTDHRALVERYRIPAEVLARLGASRPARIQGGAAPG